MKSVSIETIEMLKESLEQVRANMAECVLKGNTDPWIGYTQVEILKSLVIEQDKLIKELNAQCDQLTLAIIAEFEAA